jgi:glycosyltransferase involved in cell wall biosynthesis
MSKPLAVCYFGAYRPNYPRNLTIRRALERAGIPVTECQVLPKTPTWRRWLALTRQFLAQPRAREATVIIVAEFGHTVMPLAWLFSRWIGAALIFDPGISFYDEMVVCQNAYAPGSLRGRYLKVLDWLSFHLADLVVWFTPVDKEYFDAFFRVAPEKSAWLPPGLDETLFPYMAAPESTSPFLVHWDGSFIASHGVEVILEAAALLQIQTDIQFELVGNGPTAPAMRAQAKALNLTNLTFAGSVSREYLADSVRRAHLCLGVFRADDKLRRSLYTKEMQGMWAGRAVITGDGEAKRRVFVNQRELWMIPPNSPSQLAEAIVTLQHDPAKRQALAEAGHEAVRVLCTVEAIEKRIKPILQQALQNRHSSSQLVGQEPTRPL